MSNLFKDKTWDDFDEITQMFEPYVFSLNEALSKMPDEFDVDPKIFIEDNIISIDRLVTRKVVELGLDISATNLLTGIDFYNEFFTFSLAIDESATLDGHTLTLDKPIKVVKKDKIAYEDKEIDEIMISYVKNHLYRLSGAKRLNIKALNELVDLFNVKPKSNTKHSKISALYSKYEELLEDKTLNIRDVDLFFRFVDWNVKVIRHGNLPAMANITKIKIMMRSEIPIYSIKEENA